VLRFAKGEGAAQTRSAFVVLGPEPHRLHVRHADSVVAMRDRLELPVDPWGVPRFRLARLKETVE
jgi:hypothetical protein